MRVRQLECFRALMIHGTTTRAAELLGLSQPAVSMSIAALEQETGLRLFVRRSGRLQPTFEARLFFEEASHALEAIENTTRVAGEIRIGRKGFLSIAAYPSVSIRLLPQLISAFAQVRPETRTKIITRNSQTVRELMATQQFDLAIAELPIDYPAGRMETFHYACLCMMRPDHPLAEKSSITPRDISGVPFVTLFRGDPIHQQLAAAFSEYGAHFNVVAETELFSTACEIVRSGLGLGMVDPVVSAPFAEGLVLRPFFPEIRYSIAILQPIHGELSLIAASFVKVLQVALRGKQE